MDAYSMTDFATCFKYLTTHDPFPWQEQLFERLLAGRFPETCDIPTGLGKTSVIAIWLLAFGCSLEDHERSRIPRRLAYVVDRRVIVDQATDEARQIINRLNSVTNEASAPLLLRAIAPSIRAATFSQNDSLIALSPLRGQLADNREWCLDPSRPAIIIGTVDMIGSRLLFSGYGGLGKYYKSLQAGLLGQDTLIVVDEAHLSPTFVTTLTRTKWMLEQRERFAPFGLIQLSATLAVDEGRSANDNERPQPLQIDMHYYNKVAQKLRERNSSDVSSPDVSDVDRIAVKRLFAEKRCQWVEFTRDEGSQSKRGTADAEAKAIVDCAIEFKEQPVSVLIYGTTVDLVKRVDELLRATLGKEFNDRILLMTGGMRGLERDGLFDNKAFKQFLPERDRRGEGEAFYLVATSCAEVGVNLDADHGVFDLTTFDSMIQRCGRINRFGAAAANIKVVVDKTRLEIVRRLLQIEQSFAALTQKQDAKQEAEALGDERTELVKKIGSSRLTWHTAAYHTFLRLDERKGIDAAISVSPAALRDIPQDKSALLAPPVCPPLNEARLDDWSLTSFKQSEFRRPLVEYWLRGVVEDGTQETVLCWRSELDLLEVPSATGREELETLRKTAKAMIETIPLAPRECAKETTARSEEIIGAIAQRHPQRFVVLIRNDEYEFIPLKAFLQKKNKRKVQVEESAALDFAEAEENDEKDAFSKLASAIVFVPCGCGGLPRGIADGRDPQPVEDAVKDEWARFVLSRAEGEDRWTASRLPNDGAAIAGHESLAELVRRIEKQEGKRLLKQFDLNFKASSDDDNEEGNARSVLAYFIKRDSPDHLLRDDDSSSISLSEVTLTDHNEQVGEYARRLAEKLNLSSELIDALFRSGVRHDRGKERECWQRAVGNNDPTPLAKTGHRYFNNAINQYYRHEFGSLVDSLNDEDLSTLSAQRKDLVLHLIAAHHGYARPHFPTRAFDRDQPHALNIELAKGVMLRFERLQQHFGWWQLAYLEAVLKAADALASSGAKENESVDKSMD